MRRALGWTAALLGVPAVQVLLGYWAYAVYKYPCTDVRPSAWSACVEYSGPSPVPLLPVGGIIAVWFVVDLVLLMLGLGLLARHDANGGAAWRPGALRVGRTLGGAALGIHMLLGYWWLMAYTQGPRQSTPGECPECFRLALVEENAFEAVNSGVLFLVWVGVDVALLWLGIGLLSRRRAAPTPALIAGDW